MHTFTKASDVLPHLMGLYGRKNVQELDRYKSVLSQFNKLFCHKWAYLCSASGRVEFVGNHTDHNGGRVVACAVNLDIVAACQPNGTDVIRIEGKNRHPITFSIYDLSKVSGSASLARGVVAYLKGQGYTVGGFDAYTDSTIPTGAGVSSSAAFETVIATVISHLFNNGQIPTEQIAKAGQFAENEYFDKPCGLLDQSVVAVGGMVALDFANGLHYHSVISSNGGAFDKLQFVLINTGASHSNLSSLYAQIPADMRKVANFFHKQRLIDVDEMEFYSKYDECIAAVGIGAALRAKHFFEENHRVDSLQQALAQGDVGQVIDIVNSSGDSSSNQLRNCAVDDNDTAIQDIIRTVRAICPCGARVHGGGFAGTVLCVVPREYASQFVAQVTSIYGNNVLPLRVREKGAVML